MGRGGERERPARGPRDVSPRPFPPVARSPRNGGSAIGTLRYPSPRDRLRPFAYLAEATRLPGLHPRRRDLACAFARAPASRRGRRSNLNVLSYLGASETLEACADTWPRGTLKRSVPTSPRHVTRLRCFATRTWESGLTSAPILATYSAARLPVPFSRPLICTYSVARTTFYGFTDCSGRAGDSSATKLRYCYCYYYLSLPPVGNSISNARPPQFPRDGRCARSAAVPRARRGKKSWPRSVKRVYAFSQHQPSLRPG